MSAAVANSPLFWAALISGLAIGYALPAIIAIIRHVEDIALVVIFNAFPIGWPRALITARSDSSRQRGCGSAMPVASTALVTSSEMTGSLSSTIRMSPHCWLSSAICSRLACSYWPA